MKKIWMTGLWPKVSTFLWLIARGKLLTWDQLKLKGLEGLSIFHLCQEVEETVEHLLNQCPYLSALWDQGVIVFFHLDLNITRLTKTIENWRSSPFQNHVMNII